MAAEVSVLPPGRHKVLVFIYALAKQDVKQALSMAQALPEGNVRTDSISNVISHWCSHDVDAVLAWASSAQGKERPHALSDVLSKKVADDPADAVRIFRAILSSGQEEDRKAAADLVSRMTSGLYQHDPSLVVQFISQIGDGKLQAEAIRQLSGQWTIDDPVEASAWIKQLPTSEAKDRAVQNLISNIKRRDPESAFAWALALGEENTRVVLAVEVLRTSG